MEQFSAAPDNLAVADSLDVTPAVWGLREILTDVVGGEASERQAEAHRAGSVVRGPASRELWLDPLADPVRSDPAVSDPEIQESLDLLRSDAVSSETLLNFAARHRSTWALDVVAGRLSRGLIDWPSIRMSALRYAKTHREFDPVLDRLPLGSLWEFCRTLHVRGFDTEVEHGLLAFIAARVRGGKDVGSKNREDFLEALIAAGDTSAPETSFPLLDGGSWRQHALAVELEHPRFGGDFEIMLARLNQRLRRLGLDSISLDGAGETPFERLTATPLGAGSRGPLVTVVMATSAPSSADLSAVRSIVSQSYQSWELVLVDDGSVSDSSAIVEKIAALDPRIRVIRNAEPIGIAASWNEAIRSSNGEFVALQSGREWSHPRRLEIQVRDLLATPRRIANVVRASRALQDLSLVGRCGARLIPSEHSVVFRRSEAEEAIGYFDGVLRGSAIEFRTRIEAVTGEKVAWVGPEAPLQFVLDSNDESDELNFGSGTWMSQEWLAYRGSTRRFHSQIKSGERSGHLPYNHEVRVLTAPARLLSRVVSYPRFDCLFVLDGHQLSGRQAFIETVADEIESAVEAGFNVALLHVDAPYGVRNAGPIAERLQSLIDAGLLTQVLEDESVEASVAVVRQAGAVQGHRARRLPAAVDRVIVVEDAAAGDVRGSTIAHLDVNETLSEWFGKEAEWLRAPELPERPELVSVVVERASLRLALRLPESEGAEAVMVGRGASSHYCELSATDEGLLVATVALDQLPEGDLSVTVLRRLADGGLVSQRCWVAPSRVLIRHAESLVVPNGRDGLRVIKARTERTSIEALLQARVTQAAVLRGQVQLTVEVADEATLETIVGIRDVRGQIRSQTFAADPTHSPATFTRAITDLTDRRWRVFGVFLTPLGRVLAPVQFDNETEVEHSSRYRIRKLADDGIGIIHVVPRVETIDDRRAPVLSIVMPVFNVAPFLDASIRSVLTQDFTDFELIIIDDASTDGGRQIIEMHAALDPRIRVISLDHNTLGGAGIPSNIGILASRGKYVAFVDSDDWVTQSAMGKMIQLAEAENAELVIGDFRTFDEATRVVSEAYDGAAWGSIPLGEVISAQSHPGLLRLSPVPWRKLYRRDFVESSSAFYPEGDFFYEDNPLHWRVLSRAQRIVACDEVVSYHRMAREGQTMGAHPYKLGAIVTHANTILNSLADTPDEGRVTLFEEFIDYVSRQRWVVRKQTQSSVAEILKTRLAGIFDRAVAAEPRAIVPEETSIHFDKYRKVYPDLDLTVIIPVYNSADLLAQTLDSVLKIKGLRYDILLIDDGSTDDSLGILRKYEADHSHIHVFEQKNRGAGRARNAIIPLATGRYTYFLDADDVIDASALVRAVRKADDDQADLILVKYVIDFADEMRTQDMSMADRRIWEGFANADTNEEMQTLAVGLVNYPWNRIIRTDLLHDANIFFGPTVVHNDVLYHWHSVLAASNISYVDVTVCKHRKFQTRAQVTNIEDERRMAVLEALRGTYQRVSTLDSYRQVEGDWTAFSQYLLGWAKSRIPEAMRVTYEDKRYELQRAMSASSRPV